MSKVNKLALIPVMLCFFGLRGSGGHRLELREGRPWSERLDG